MIMQLKTKLADNSVIMIIHNGFEKFERLFKSEKEIETFIKVNNVSKIILF